MAVLTVFPAKFNARNRPMGMNFMSEDEIRATINDEPVQFFMRKSDGQLIKIFSGPRLSLSALIMASPVVNDAFKKSGEDEQNISEVILPPGDIRAYKDILGWVMDMMRAGMIPKFRRITESPLLHYDRIQLIATKLGIDYLKVRMIRRINNILKISNQPTFHLEIEEMRIIFTRLRLDHPLRKSVATVLRDVNARHLMERTFCAELMVLVWEIPALQYDLYGYTLDRYRHHVDSNAPNVIGWTYDVIDEDEHESEGGVKLH